MSDDDDLLQLDLCFFALFLEVRNVSLHFVKKIITKHLISILRKFYMHKGNKKAFEIYYTVLNKSVAVDSSEF